MRSSTSHYITSFEITVNSTFALLHKDFNWAFPLCNRKDAFLEIYPAFCTISNSDLKVMVFLNPAVSVWVQSMLRFWTFFAASRCNSCAWRWWGKKRTIYTWPQMARNLTFGEPNSVLWSRRYSLCSLPSAPVLTLSLTESHNWIILNSFAEFIDKCDHIVWFIVARRLISFTGQTVALHC